MNFSYLKTPSGILKLFEIALVVADVVILRHQGVGGFGGTPAAITNNSYFGASVPIAALIVTPLLLAVYLAGNMNIQKSFFEPVINAFFGASLFVYGCLAIDFYRKMSTIITIRDYGLAMGSLSLIAGFAYLADLFFAIKAMRS